MFAKKVRREENNYHNDNHGGMDAIDDAGAPRAKPKVIRIQPLKQSAIKQVSDSSLGRKYINHRHTLWLQEETRQYSTFTAQNPA